ncbi:hypothetical protein K438DRAFT_1976132 [Mycena galopus ATCC 62051]|nr:hypothetical protein K438DRAFT_1976132 [Mycena galopus ATCC 62051]
MSASSTASAQSANARRKARQRTKKSNQGMDDGQEPDQEIDRDVIENPDQPIRNFHDHPSAPPRDPDSNDDRFDADRFSDDHRLEEYAGPQPVQLLDPDARILKGSLPLPTFQPYRTIIEGDVDIIARRQHALDLGAEGFAKPFLRHPKIATRRMYTSVFHAELELLQRLVTSIDTTMLLNKENAYRLQKSTYWVFWKLLDDLRKRAKPAFEIFGSLTPTIPTWGRNEDPLTFYASNEFEILGICYRAEVENFLALLHERFDFISDEIRPPDEEAKIFYEDFHRPASVGMGLANSENCSFDASPFRLRPASFPGSAKGPFVNKEEKESKFRNPPEDVPSTGGNAAARRAHRARVKAVTDEDDRETAIPFPRNALSRGAFEKSSTPPSKFHEAFAESQFEKDRKSYRQSKWLRDQPSGTPRHDALPHFSQLGFAIPDHSSRPSEGAHLNRSNPKSKASGKTELERDPIDSESKDSEDGKKGSKRPNRNERERKKPQRRSGRDGGDPGDDSSSSDDGNWEPRRDLPRRPLTKKKGLVHDSSDEDRDGRYFDLRLKDADVPTWDGDPDKLLRWIQRCNLIAEDGPKAWRQLGKVVPRAFTGTAQDWYFTLPVDYQQKIRQNWSTMRQALADFFLSSKWLDKTRTKALRGSYRQAGYSTEKPSEYFIRKRELFNSVYSFEDSSVMSEVMNGAPRSWCTVLDTQKYDSIVEFHAAIIFHEDTLMDLPMNKLENHARDDDVEQREPFQKPDTGVIF